MARVVALGVARLVAEPPAGPAPGYRFPVPAPAPHDVPVPPSAPAPVTARVAVLSVPAACLVALLLSIWLDLRPAADGLGDRLVDGPGWPWTLNGVLLSALACVVLVRQPRSGTAWALVGLGAFWGLDGLAQSYLRAGVSAEAVWPAATAVMWFWARVGSLLPVVVAVLLLVFPTGRLLEGAWGWASRGALGLMAVGFLVFLTAPAPDPEEPLPPGLDLDPTTIAALGGAAGPAARTLTLAAFVVPVLVVVVRHHRARGTERDQVRWLLWSVLAMALTLAAAQLYDGPGVDLALTFVVMVLPGAAITVALVAPGLVPIGDLLARTLAWGGVAGVLLAVDLAVVALLDRVLAESLTRTQVVAVVLLLSALVYAPVRARAWALARRLTRGRRDAPYDVVAGLAERLDRAEGVEDRLQEVAHAVADALGVGYVGLEVERIGGGTWRSAVGVRPAQVRTLPVHERGAEVGSIALPARGVRARLSARDERLVGDLVRQGVAAVRAAQLAEELQRSRHQLVTAREEERRRIRRDLHDGLGPALSGVVFSLESARLLLERDPVSAAEQVGATSRHLQEVVADVRRLVHDLRPPALDDRGLVGALEQLAEGCPLPVRVRAGQLPALPAAVEVAAYRIAAEAVTNVVRHAGATRCSVRLEVVAGVLEVEVVDDGVGVDPARPAGVGLLSLRERAEELGGSTTLTCPAADGHGTRVLARLPMRAAGSGAPAVTATPVGAP